MNKFKDILTESLGMFGTVLYTVISMITAFLPLWVILAKYVESNILSFLIIVAFYIFSSIFLVIGGIINLILWIWGLVLVIIDWPIWFTIVYFVFFAVTITKFIITLIGRRH